MKLAVFVFLTLSTVVTSAQVVFEDMILVEKGKTRFYLDIFEMNCGKANELAAKKGTVYCPFGTEIIWKPSRMDFDSAKAACEQQGKRLPTEAEWLMAGSRYGKNKNYTLREDRLQDSSGTYIPNIMGKGGQSLPTTDFAKIGIDAIGTVGMTGNRAEWVIGANGRSMQCGGQYESTNLAELQLSTTCSSTRVAASATARCVAEVKADTQVVYSSYVSGELLNYIESMSKTKNLPMILIQENQFTKEKNYELRIKFYPFTDVPLPAPPEEPIVSDETAEEPQEAIDVPSPL